MQHDINQPQKSHGRPLKKHVYLSKPNTSIMKKTTLILALTCISAGALKAQLYSSGNNVIAGNSVGIGNATPSASTMLHIKRATSGGNLWLENSNNTGSQNFRLMNDNATHYATFTKYGSGVTGGFNGISTLYPFASALAFGNNGGPMLNASNQNIGFALFKAGTYKMRIHIDAITENVGLGGNAQPRALVHINSSTTGDTLKISNNTTGHTKTDGLNIYNTGNEAFVTNLENSNLNLGTNNTNFVKLVPAGAMVIGNTNTPTGYKLYVEQGILTEKVKVAIKTSANWADYVFDENYNLQPLSAVEQFIKEHKHLPGIPSTQDVMNNGLDLGSMDAKLLEKVEELTLHMIRLEKEMNQLKAENERLRAIQEKH